MNNNISKIYIIDYLKNYYNTTGLIPNSRDKNHPFSLSTVANKFGGWNKALEQAKIPLRKNKPIKVNCNNCKIIFEKLYNQIKKYPNHFCSRSCSAIYNNTYKKTGINISKLELYIQNNINPKEYIFNDRFICNGLELDIYNIKLNLGFEINGICHYKPIYGESKLENTIKKDNLKNIICKNKHIILYTIIDNNNKFTLKYGNQIINIIYLITHFHKYKDILYNINKNYNYQIKNICKYTYNVDISKNY